MRCGTCPRANAEASLTLRTELGQHKQPGGNCNTGYCAPIQPSAALSGSSRAGSAAGSHVILQLKGHIAPPWRCLPLLSCCVHRLRGAQPRISLPSSFSCIDRARIRPPEGRETLCSKVGRTSSAPRIIATTDGRTPRWCFKLARPWPRGTQLSKPVRDITPRTSATP